MQVVKQLQCSYVLHLLCSCKLRTLYKNIFVDLYKIHKNFRLHSTNMCCTTGFTIIINSAYSKALYKRGWKVTDLFLSLFLFLCKALHSDDPASGTFFIVSWAEGLDTTAAGRETTHSTSCTIATVTRPPTTSLPHLRSLATLLVSLITAIFSFN